jgi:hypothetical protein
MCDRAGSFRTGKANQRQAEPHAYLVHAPNSGKPHPAAVCRVWRLARPAFRRCSGTVGQRWPVREHRAARDEIEHEVEGFAPANTVPTFSGWLTSVPLCCDEPTHHLVVAGDVREINLIAAVTERTQRCGRDCVSVCRDCFQAE